MNKILLFCISLILFISACSKKVTEKAAPAQTVVKEVVKEVIPPELPSPETPPSVQLPEGIDDRLILRIQKTACFGKCPVFVAEIYKDGKAVYSGLAHTKRKGKFHTVVNEAFIQKVQAKAAESHFWTMKDFYPDANNLIADIPSTITYIRQENKGKLITNNHDAPKSLLDLEKWLENEIDSLDWKESKE